MKKKVEYTKSVDTGHEFTSSLESRIRDFRSFYQQYDKRRGKDFCKTFPELAVWYNQIEVDQTIPDVEMKDGSITHFEDGEYKPE